MSRSYFGILAIVAGLVMASQLQASTIDATTGGSWIGVYGGSGYILNGYKQYAGEWEHPALTGNDLALPPSYVSSYTYSATSMSATWPAASVNASAILANPGPGPAQAWPGFVYGNSVANGGFGPTTISLTLATDAPAFQLALYSFDTSTASGGIGDSITTQWGAAAPFDSAVLSGGMSNGKWAIFDVTPNGQTELNINFTEVAPATGYNVAGMMFHTVPEPGTIVLLSTGLLGLLAYAWRKRK